MAVQQHGLAHGLELGLEGFELAGPGLASQEFFKQQGLLLLVLLEQLIQMSQKNITEVRKTSRAMRLISFRN